MINNPEPPIDPPDVLQGNRVELRTTTEADIPQIHAWMSDPEVSQYVDNHVPSLERSYELFRNLQIFRNLWMASIVLRENNTLIGDCHLNILNGRVHTGIVIGAKEEWGKRYGEEVMQLLIDFSRERLPVSHMELVVADLNLRARRLYERLGFCIAKTPLLEGALPLDEGNTRMELQL